MTNFRSLATLSLALSMGFGGLASAQDRDRGTPDRHDRQTERRGPPARVDHHQPKVVSSRWDSRDHHTDSRHRADQNRSHGNHGYNRRSEWRDQRGQWRGAGTSHGVRNGAYLTPQYRGGEYVVENWRGHHLKTPPRGYHWVQNGGNYALAAITTGVILHILFNN